MDRKDSLLRGVIVAQVTPMDEAEKVNLKELRRQSNRMVEAGIHGIFCLGTNGEFYALTLAEKLSIIEAVKDEVGDRVPVYAGTGCITTAETLELTKKAEAFGIDGVSVITPYFVAVSQNELIEYYREVAGCTSLPVVLYSIPARTGNLIEYTTVAALSGVPNIAGIKDSSGNFENSLLYLEATPDDFRVLSGNDSLLLPTLMAGGTGGVCGMANLIPERLVSIYELWKQGKQKEAIEAQRSIRPMRNLMKLANPNSVVKRILNLMGHPVGPARRPVAGKSEALDAEIKRVLALYEEVNAGP